MHELGICRSLIDSALAVLDERRIATRVTAVTVEVGCFTSVVPAALQFAFEVLSRDTQLDGAALQVERIPLRTRCRDCGAEAEPQFPMLLCPQCDGVVTIVSGRELRLVSIDVAEEAA